MCNDNIVDPPLNKYSTTAIDFAQPLSAQAQAQAQAQQASKVYPSSA